MAENLGKKFEKCIEESFSKLPNITVVRLHDQTTGFKGSVNPCDFLMFHKPYLYALECKSVHGKTLPFSNITDFQFKSLLEMSYVSGVYAGVLVWFIDYDVTMYYSIQLIKRLKDAGKKSVHYYIDWLEYVEKAQDWAELKGIKKRIFFEYDAVDFLSNLEFKYD